MAQRLLHGGQRLRQLGGLVAALRADVARQVALADLYGSSRGDVRFRYRLAVRPPRPDFALYLLPEPANQVEGITVRAGGRALVYAQAARKDGYNRPIRVEAVGLPEGLSADPVVIGPGQAQAPLVLTAAPGAKAIVGPIRVDIGFSPAGPEALPVFTQERVGGELRIVQVGEDLPPAERPLFRYDPAGEAEGWWQKTLARVVLHLSIGEAF